MALPPLVDQRWFLLRVRARSGDTITVIEAAHGVVLGSGASSLKAALREACARPKNGKSRRPRIVVVADEADAAELKGAMPGVAIEVEAPPEHLIAPVQTDQLRERASGGKRTLGWSDELFDEMFTLTEELFELEPWELLADTEWLRVRAPWQGGEEGVLIVVGAAGEQYGFLYFPEPRSAQRFAALANLGSRTGQDLLEDTDLGEYFAFNLDEEHEVPPELVMAGRRLYFHGPRYPLAIRVFGTSAEVASPLDASRLVSLGAALCELVAEHGEALERREPLSLTYEGITLSIGRAGAESSEDEPPSETDAQ